MEKKPFESPEVKVVEIRPRSIIQSSCIGDACTEDECPSNHACSYDCGGVYN